MKYDYQNCTSWEDPTRIKAVQSIINNGNINVILILMNRKE